MNYNSSKAIYPLLLVFIFIPFFFVGLGKPVVIDYDEGVYAEVSREMFLADEWIQPTLNGEDFFEKPPMLYWSQIIGYKLFGVTSLGARFFNAVAGLVTVLVLFYAAKTPLGVRHAFHGSLILGSSLIFVYLTRVAMTDMLLTMFLVICLALSWHGVERAMRQESGGSLLFCLGCFFAGCAMLTKGVIGGLFPFITAVIYLLSIGKISILFRKSWIIPGTIILVTVGFSWYILLGFIHPEGFSFMKDLFIKHHMGRFSSAMESHSGPFYYYLPVLLIGMIPWCCYLPLCFYKLKIANNSDPASRFLRLFVIFSLLVLVFFSAAATKLPNYIFPVIPGFALLFASLFELKEFRFKRAWQISGAMSGGLFILLGLLFALLPFIIPYLPSWLGENGLKAPMLAESIEIGNSPWLVAAILVAAGVGLIRTVKCESVQEICKTVLVSGFAFSGAMFLLVLPIYDKLNNLPLVNIAEHAAVMTPEDGIILMYKVGERPSANFAANRRTLYKSERDHQELPTLFARPEIKVGITTSYYFSRLADFGIQARKISSDTGYVLFTL